MRRVPTTMSAPLQLFQCLQLRLVKEVHLISTSEVEMHNAGVDACGRDACHGYAMVSKCKLNVCKSNRAPEDPFYIDQFTISQARCSLSVCPAGRSPPCFRNASRSCKKPKNGAKPVPAERSNMRCILLRYLQQSDRMTVKASESMSTMITQAFSKAFHLKRPETWTPRRVVDCRRAMTCWEIAIPFVQNGQNWTTCQNLQALLGLGFCSPQVVWLLWKIHSLL